MFSVTSEEKNIKKLEIFSPSHDKDFGKYGVSNPHPGYGNNPNIINEAGHTRYPKRITDQHGKRVIVNNPDEEAEATGKEVEKPELPKNDGWS